MFDGDYHYISFVAGPLRLSFFLQREFGVPDIGHDGTYARPGLVK